MSASLWHVVLLAVYGLSSVTSSPIAGDEKSEEKRSEWPCTVAGRTFQHGEIFVYPGFSHCLKYRCDNGGYSLVQEACERNGRCTPVGSVLQDGCRSLRCVHEKRGSMNYFILQPTEQDMCDAEGRCVQKNVPFEMRNCQSYQCVPTQNGGYNFQPLGYRSCLDELNNRCVSPGTVFAKWVNGHFYRNCACLSGGGYSCRG